MSDAVVAAAARFLGTPYRHQGSQAQAGCDCLGLLRGVWREVVGPEPGPLPPYRPDMRDAANAAALREAAERWLEPATGPVAAGDVLLFRLNRMAEPKHCAILISPDRFIHAQETLGVVEANLSEGWRTRICGRFRFPGHP